MEAWLGIPEIRDGAGVLVAAWEVIESKGKQDIAYKPLDSKMVGS